MKTYTRDELKDLTNKLFWHLRHMKGNIVKPGDINEWFDKEYPEDNTISDEQAGLNADDEHPDQQQYSDDDDTYYKNRDDEESENYTHIDGREIEDMNDSQL